MAKKTQKLEFEDYMNYFSNPQEHFITVPYMNQIIGMHGFLKMTRNKAILIEELKTIDLVSPFRSTLKEKISSSAFLHPDEVKKDLADLQWNEFLIESIQIQRSESNNNQNNNSNLLDDKENQFLQNHSSIVVKTDGGKPKLKRKRRNLKKLTEIPPPTTTTTTTTSVLTTENSSCLSLALS